MLNNKSQIKRRAWRFFTQRACFSAVAALSDETKKLHRDRYRDFFRDQNFWDLDRYSQKLRKVSIPRSLETRCHTLLTVSPLAYYSPCLFVNIALIGDKYAASKSCPEEIYFQTIMIRLLNLKKSFTSL